MIQISTEELFRKIETEHNCNFDDANNNNNNHKLEESNLTQQLGQQLEGTAIARRRPSYSQGNASPASNKLGRDMSSILPATYGNIRDPNNNTNTNNNTSKAGNEDEVQAVLVTGCGSKIGTNIAVAFAARGLKVALVDFDIQQTEAVARECQEKSPKNRVPLQIVADISQLAEAHKVIDRTIEAFGRLDVLVNTVNNTGLMEAKFAASGDDDPHVFEQYHKIIANNMHSVTYLCISAAPYLRKTKGSIVNVSSITNNETGSYKFAYCMSKAGISTLTKCLATDLAPDIKVICVSPKSDATG